MRLKFAKCIQMKVVIYQTKALRHPVGGTVDSWLTENEISRNFKRTTFVSLEIAYEITVLNKKTT